MTSNHGYNAHSSATLAMTGVNLRWPPSKSPKTQNLDFQEITHLYSQCICSYAAAMPELFF